MELDCPHLSLARYWTDEDDDRRIALVDSLDALRLCNEGGFEAVSAADARWDFERESRRLRWEIQDFAASVGLASPFSSSCDDDDLADLVREAIERGELVGLRKNPALFVRATKATVEQRRLVAQIYAKTRGRLYQGGRQYKLVAGDDLDGTDDRNSYEVVARADATRVLDHMGKEPGIAAELAALLGKARNQLTRDWRPPLAPDGLILLRRSAVNRSYSSDSGPALTPSQMKKLASKDWIEIEVVEEDGTPYTGGYRIERPDKPPLEDDFDDKGFFGDHDLDPGDCKFSLIERKKAKTPAAEAQSVASRVRMVGMIFDANKCFLLPQALPGIKMIIDMHRQHEAAEVLIAGHAEGDEELAGIDIALARADMLAAYLTSNPEPWLAWFDSNKARQSRWGTREVQLMLSALPQGGTPFYQGNASGITGEKTIAAVKAFQKYFNQEKGGQLIVDGTPGPETCKALVDTYLGIEDTTLAADIVPVTHGCEGHFDDTITKDGLQPDDRRLEVFFFEPGIDPKPAGNTSSAGSAEYAKWIGKLTKTKSFEHHGIHVLVVNGGTDPIAGAKVTYEGPTSGEALADDHGFVSLFGLKAGEYTIHATKAGLSIPDAKLTYPTAKTVPYEDDSEDGGAGDFDGEDVEESDTEQNTATRIRMVGMMFDANKCFLLPQALPGINIIIDMHRQHETAEVLIVGHAEGDEELAGIDIAIARAEMLAAYLTSNPEPWLAWFASSKAKQSRWGTREVQLMLSALPQGGTPFYEGNASGITGDKTVAAVKAFQQYFNQNKDGQLVVDGKPGPETCKALVTTYMGIEDTTLAADIVPVTHGCEGHFDDTITEDGLQPDDRRIEVFFFDKTIDPKPADNTSRAGSSEYPAWIEKLTETQSYENHGFHVLIVDGSKRPIGGAKVTYEGPTSGEAQTDDHGFVSLFGLKAGEYTIHATKEGLSIADSKLTYPTAKTVPVEDNQEDDHGSETSDGAEDTLDVGGASATATSEESDPENDNDFGTSDASDDDHDNGDASETDGTT